MADNLKAASISAGLSPTEKKKVDDYNKSLTVHRELLNLPPDVATTVYNNKPENQKRILAENYGTEDPIVKPSRGWLGTAWAYTGGALKEGFGLGLAGLQNVSDFTTRAYRAIAIPLSEGQVGFAWDEANDKGDKVFNDGRIEDAKEKYDNLVKQVGVEEAKKRLGNEALANQMQQQSVQERFTQTIEKLKEVFVSLLSPLMPVFDVLADIMGVVGPIAGILGQAVKFAIELGKYLLPIYGIFKGIQIANMVTTALMSSQAGIYKVQAVLAEKSLATKIIGNTV